MDIHTETAAKIFKKDITEIIDLYKRSEVDWEAIKYKGSKSYCCYKGGKLIGHCQVLDDGTICNLVVDREHRRQGIASKILRQAMSEGAKYLGCFKSNVKFYVNRGFKVYYVEFSKEFGTSLYYLRTAKSNDSLTLR